MIEVLISIFVIHYISDYIFQSRWVANNKSSNVGVCALHSILYSIPFMLLWFDFVIFCQIQTTHFFTDLITSRLTSKYYNEDNRKMFWIIIGLDQLLHIFQLLYIFKDVIK